MIKNFLLIAFVIVVASCSGRPFPDSNCPLVTIPRDKAYMIQKVNYSDDFEIELTGYEGFCYYEPKINRHTAYIKPEFTVYRLRANDETDVDFNFYTEAVQGPPEFLGKRVYSTGVTIGAGQLEKTFTGKQIKVLVPKNAEDFEIFLALDVSTAQYIYNQRTFDLKYRYNLPDEEMIERTVIINTEPANFSPAGGASSQSPSTGKSSKSGCSSCSL